MQNNLNGIFQGPPFAWRIKSTLCRSPVPATLTYLSSTSRVLPMLYCLMKPHSSDPGLLELLNGSCSFPVTVAMPVLCWEDLLENSQAQAVAHSHLSKLSLSLTCWEKTTYHHGQMTLSPPCPIWWHVLHQAPFLPPKHLSMFAPPPVPTPSPLQFILLKPSPASISAGFFHQKSFRITPDILPGQFCVVSDSTHFQ